MSFQYAEASLPANCSGAPLTADLSGAWLFPGSSMYPASYKVTFKLAPAGDSSAAAAASRAFVVGAATHAGSNGWAQESDRAWLLVEAMALRNGEHLSVEGDAALHGRLEQVRDVATVAWRQQRALLRAQSVAMRWKAKTFAKKRAW